MNTFGPLSIQGANPSAVESRSESIAASISASLSRSIGASINASISASISASIRCVVFLVEASSIGLMTFSVRQTQQRTVQQQEPESEAESEPSLLIRNKLHQRQREQLRRVPQAVRAVRLAPLHPAQPQVELRLQTSCSPAVPSL